MQAAPRFFVARTSLYALALQLRQSRSIIGSGRMKKTKHIQRLWMLGCLLAGLFACKSPTNVDAAEQPQESAIPLPELIEVTTAVAMERFSTYPDGFVQDSFFKFDSTTHHSTQLYYPKRPGDETFNRMISKYCELKADLPDTQRGDSDHSEFSMWVVDMQVNGDIVSIQWKEQSYYSGAAHFTHGNPCFNWNVKERVRMDFHHFFSFSGQNSKSRFCEIFNQSRHGGDQELAPSDLTDALNLFIGSDSLALCFDDYDRGPSMTQMKASLADLDGFWRANVRREMELD